MHDHTEKILLVDDDEHTLASLELMLRHRRKEWETRTARGVDEAIQILLAEPCDAVVSDINMPGLDGFDLLHMMRETEDLREIPVIILTGLGQSGLKSQALEMGASDLLSKPVEPSELIARIKSVLQLKRYQDEIRDHNQQLERHVRERTEELERARIELIWRLGKAGEFRDTDTGNHVVRVGHYTHRLALAMGLEEAYAWKLFFASPLHDIGKIGIPDAILLKKDRLTPAEWSIMQTHTLIGAEILRENIFDTSSFANVGYRWPQRRDSSLPNTLIDMAARIAECHHERWDGMGYPNQLGGESIPLEARITNIADVYDALSSKRPYKGALPEEEVLAIMHKGRGTKFDPEIFAAFEECLDDLREIRTGFPGTLPSVGDALKVLPRSTT